MPSFATLLALLAGCTQDPPPAQGPRWGWVQPDGSWAIPARFESARGFHGGRAAARDRGRWGLVDPEGAWVLEPAWAAVCDAPTWPVCAQDPGTGRWGWIGEDGAWVIPARYDAVLPLVDGVAPVGVQVGEQPLRLRPQQRVPVIHWGLIDGAGQVVVAPAPAGDPAAWTAVGEVREGRIPVSSGGRWGYVDTRGAWVIPARYGAARPFRGGHAGVMSEAWQVIDGTGAVVVPGAHGLADGAAEGRLVGGTGYHALDGSPVGPRWSWIRPLVDGVGVGMRAERWAAVGPDGAERFEPRFARLTDYAGGRALGAELVDGRFRWGIADLEGAWVQAPRWVAVDEGGFREGLAAVAEAP